jgi:hypothetical protein
MTPSFLQMAAVVVTVVLTVAAAPALAYSSRPGICTASASGIASGMGGSDQGMLFDNIWYILYTHHVI